MISAAIVGLGRCGQELVAAVQGKSSRIRFVRGVRSARARDFAMRHGLALTNALAEARQVRARSYAAKPSPDPRDGVAVAMEFASGATGLMACGRPCRFGAFMSSAPRATPRHAAGT